MSLGETQGKARDKSVVHSRYELYGMDLSFFTQKVRAAVQWYFPGEFDLVVKNISNAKMIETRSGTHQVPVLITPENWCIADSTPVLKLLDSRLPSQRLYPCDKLTAAVVALVEEYFDEWMARLTVHTRWNNEESALFAATSMLRMQGVPEDQLKEAVSSPASPMNWGKRVCRALGMSSEIQIRAGEEELMRLHKALDQHLESHKYILGDAPCVIDAVLLGGLRAHFLTDPWPKKYLKDLKNVQRYYDTWDTPIHPSVRATPIDINNLPPFIELVLKEMGSGFKNFVLGNADGQAKGAKSFEADVYGEKVSYLSRPYVEKSRRMLQDYVATILNEEESVQYTSLLRRFNLDDLYSPSVRRSKF